MKITKPMTDVEQRAYDILNRIAETYPTIAYKIVGWGAKYKSVLWFGISDGFYSIHCKPRITDISREVSRITNIKWSTKTGYTLCTNPDLIAYDLKQRFPTLEVEKL